MARKSKCPECGDKFVDLDSHIENIHPETLETEDPLVERRAELQDHLSWMTTNGFNRVGNIEAELSVVNRELDN